MTYRAPVNEMLFMMNHVGGLERAIDDGIYPDLSIDVVRDILQEAARDQFLNWKLKPMVVKNVPLQAEAALTFRFATTLAVPPPK